MQTILSKLFILLVFAGIGFLLGYYFTELKQNKKR
jgi:hypothetical protein